MNRMSLKLCLLLMIVIFFAIQAYGVIVAAFYSDKNFVRNVETNLSQYQKAVSQMNQMSKINLIANFRGSIFLLDYYLRNRVQIILNNYYSRNLFVISSFKKLDPDFETIYSYEFSNRNPQEYSIEKVMSDLSLKDDQMKQLFKTMNKLNVNVINRNNRIIEFTDASFLYSTSLDCYRGYLYIDGPYKVLENDKYYEQLKRVRPGWYEFTRNRIVFKY